MSYGTAANSYNIQSYAGQLSNGNPALYLAGATLAAPPGSNLPGTAAVGRYGAFVGPVAQSNLVGVTTTNETKALPMRIGKTHVLVSFVTFKRGNNTIGAPLPAYGN